MPRPQLVRECLTGAPSSSRVSLIVAPAGFGKTTLLGEARAALEAQGTRTVWLNCDERDRDPSTFLDSIAQAFKVAGFKLLGPLRSAESLAHECARIGESIGLIVDELEVAISEPVEEIVEAISRSAPDTLRVLIATRALSAQRFIGLELDGYIRRIEAGLLRFTEQEAANFLAGSAPTEALSHMIARADGWPFVLQMLRMHATRRAQLGLQSQGWHLPESRISEYLATEVMSWLDEKLRSFIIQTSLLTTLTVPDATALTGWDDCASLLLRLEPLVPIVTLEREPLAAQFHPLFRRHLQGSLESLGQSKVLSLHERLAHHFAQTQRVPEAVECAMACGSVDLAVAIVQRAGAMRIVFSQGMTHARRVLDFLPRSAIQGNLKLRLLEIAALALQERGVEAPHELAILDAEITEGRFESQIDDTTQADMALANTLIRFGAVEHEITRPNWDILHKATQAGRVRARDDARFWVAPLVHEFHLLLRHGPLAQAITLVEDYISVHAQDVRFRTAADAWLYRAMYQYARGECDAAEATAGRAATLMLNRDGHEEGHSAQLVHAVMGHMRYMRNDTRGAVAHFEAIPISQRCQVFEVYSAQHVWRALCDAANGEIDLALERLDTARIIAMDRRLPHLSMLTSAVRCELLANHFPGLVASGLAVAEDLFMRGTEWAVDESIGWITRAWIAHANVSLLVNQQQFGEAMKVAKAFAAATADSGRRLLRADAWLLVARASEPVEKSKPQLQEALGNALQLTVGTGASRLFLDHGTTIIERTREYAALQAGPTAQWARQIVAPVSRLDALSSRQKAVLDELCKGQSTKAIARNLRLSPETVKWHLKAIFERLGASSRQEAIDAVRGLELSTGAQNGPLFSVRH